MTENIMSENDVEPEKMFDMLVEIEATVNKVATARKMHPSDVLFALLFFAWKAIDQNAKHPEDRIEIMTSSCEASLEAYLHYKKISFQSKAH